MTKIKTQSILLCESWQVAQPSYVYRVSNLPLRVVRSLFGNKQGGICDGKLSVAKVTFGAEPKDYDIQEFVLKHYYDLQFSPAVETIVKKDKKNPKRVLRDVKKQLQNNGIGTKSQQALKLQHELKKEEYKSNSKHKKQMDAEQKFKLKQQKKKAKHRGH